MNPGVTVEFAGLPFGREKNCLTPDDIFFLGLTDYGSWWRTTVLFVTSQWITSSLTTMVFLHKKNRSEDHTGVKCTGPPENLTLQVFGCQAWTTISVTKSTLIFSFIPANKTVDVTVSTDKSVILMETIKQFEKVFYHYDTPWPNSFAVFRFMEFLSWKTKYTCKIKLISMLTTALKDLSVSLCIP